MASEEARIFLSASLGSFLEFRSDQTPQRLSLMWSFYRYHLKQLSLFQRLLVTLPFQCPSPALSSFLLQLRAILNSHSTYSQLSCYLPVWWPCSSQWLQHFLSIPLELPLNLCLHLSQALHVQFPSNHQSLIALAITPLSVLYVPRKLEVGGFLSMWRQTDPKIYRSLLSCSVKRQNLVPESLGPGVKGLGCDLSSATAWLCEVDLSELLAAPAVRC